MVSGRITPSPETTGRRGIMTTGKNDDAAYTRADAFPAEPTPQVTEHLAERRAEDFDAEAGQVRFEARLGAHTGQPAVPAKGPAGSARPTAAGWIKRSRISLSDAWDTVHATVLRPRTSTTGSNASRQGHDNRPGPGMGDPASRDGHVPEIDGWRPRPFGLLAAPEEGAVMQRVQQLTLSLEGAIDESTGASLDLLIGSWAGRWIATVEADYIDHCREIIAQRARARQWLAESAQITERENEKLDRIGAAYSACLSRLTVEQADRAIGTHSWSGLAAGVLLAPAGVLAVTVAFRNTLALALPPLPGILAWLTATGATCLALAAAASIGISLAIRRQVGRIGSGLATALITVAWIGLGLATFLIPLLGTGAHFTPLAALFSGATYLISGAYAIFLSEQLYDPEYFAFRRLEKRYSDQAKLVTMAEADKDRAEAARELYDGELQREDQRRIAAIADRKALAAEAANYARILMAAMLQDPAKTGITKTGPVPEPIQQSLNST
jgi:hypothetical protein